MTKVVKLLAWMVAVGLLAAACSRGDRFDARARVGLMPEGFAPAPVASAADATAQVERYLRALELEGVAVASVRPGGAGFLVTLRETDTGRGAFGLDVARDGRIAPKGFPGMAPEMMWNQKYGHRARPRLDAIRMPLDAAGARAAAARALAGEPGLTAGEPLVFYGYYLFPLRKGDAVAGEAAVNAVDGTVVWGRFEAAAGGAH